MNCANAMQRVSLLLLLLFAWIAIPASLDAQSESEGELDLAAWESLSQRADAVIEAGAASDSALIILQFQLLEWHQRANDRQKPLSKEIERLNASIAALGASGSGERVETEAEAERRAELVAELELVSAPYFVVGEIIEQSDELVSKIDEIIQVRRRASLFRLDPSPLIPQGWGAAASVIGEYFDGLLARTGTIWASDAQRALIWQSVPAILVYLVLAALAFTYLRRWFGTAMELFRRQQWALPDASVPRLSDLVTAFLLPAAGVFLVSKAFESTGVLYLQSAQLVEVLPSLGVAIFGTFWLGLCVFADDNRAIIPSQLGIEWSRHARIAVSLLGWSMATRILASVFLADGSAEPGAQSVLMLPAMLIGVGAMLRLGSLLRSHAAFVRSQGEHNVWHRSIGAIGWLTLCVAGVGGILFLIGYGLAARYLVFSTMYSLVLLAVIFSAKRMLSHGYLQVLRIAGGESAVMGRVGLVPVFFGLALILASIPVFATIWGATRADISQYWSMAREGLLIGDQRITLTDVISLILVFTIVYVGTRLVQAVLRKSVLPNTKLDAGAQTAIATGTGYVGIILAVILAVSSAGLDFTNLAIVAGALSVGIGFGLQSVVSNFVSGIILLIERPINRGDWIVAGGVTGTVTKISVRSTHIQTFDRAVVVVPNTDLMSGQVTNWTLGNRLCRTRIPVGVAYGTDPRKVESILLEIATQHPAVLSEPAPQAIFMNFGADALEFELRAFLVDTNFMLSAKSDMNFEIARRFEEEGISIPFAQRDIWIRNAEELGEVARSATSAEEKNDNPTLPDKSISPRS